ncbi:MAG: VWA domain-containing protein [Planctomycetaceae bacterium]|nr:VWA domain-containing protein [Planctomycetaceae bacterium]
MTFLNTSLLAGAAAFAIPLVIHILNRSRYRTVEWGAMHLLESVIRVNHRRFRMDQLILLLIRCAIPALLAFCLARPVLTGNRVLEGNQPAGIVILLDNSYSMDRSRGVQTHFQMAIDSATQIISNAPRGSQFSVIAMGGRPTPLFDQPIFDQQAAISRLKQMDSGFGAADVASSFEVASQVISKMTTARRELIVISDFQQSDWNAYATAGNRGLRQSLDNAPIQADLHLMPIGFATTFKKRDQPSSELSSEKAPANISVDGIQIASQAIAVGQTVPVRTAIHNHGDETQSARIILRIDGKQTSVTQTFLAADSTSQTLLTCEFDTPGSHVVEVEAISDDDVSTDNKLAAAITVWEDLKIVIVDGAVSREPLKSESDYLSIALTPFTFGRVQLADLISTRTVTLENLNKDAISDARVVILANVSRLNDQQLEFITQFVRLGGSLLVTAGNQVDLNWYRQKFYSSGQGPLPLPFGERQGTADSSESSPSSIRRIARQHFDHPALDFFNEPSNGDLSDAIIEQWYSMDTTSPEDITVVARLNNGDPLLVEKPFGQGTVFQFATTCDTDWTDLPTSSVWVPFVQQIAVTLASRISPPRNIETGQSAILILDEASADTAPTATETDSSSATMVSVSTPSGLAESLSIQTNQNHRAVEFNGTRKPGIYTMTLPSGAPVHFVATTSPVESRLQTISAAQLNDVAEALDARLPGSAAEYLKQDQLRRNGQEIWKYALALLLAFMASETILQQRFARAIQ